MKIALLTSVAEKVNPNLGSTLQAYALYSILASDKVVKKATAEIINFIPSRSIKGRIRQIAHLCNSFLMNPNMTYPIRLINNLISRRRIENFLQNRRLQKFEEFKTQHLRFTSSIFQNIYEMSNLDLYYDVFIVGSDMIWSPQLCDEELLSVYLLGFVKRAIKIAYGPSIGKEISKWALPIFGKYLRDFHRVSVRDRASANALKKSLGINPMVVLDPTCLLTPEEFMKIESLPKIPPTRPYILVYDLNKSAEIIPQVKKIAKKYNWTLVTFSPTKEAFSFYTYGPSEFIWLCRNADFIISSSYHGTVLAVLFAKPFYAINPSFASYRISDFLYRIGLIDRMIYEPKCLLKLNFNENINWDSVHTALENERSRSYEFLRKALEAVGSCNLF